MRLLVICSVIFLSACTTLQSSNYVLDSAPRGLSFNNSTGNQVLESRLCDGEYCLFIEQRELRLLGWHLGDSNQEIFDAVKKMDQLERAQLFKGLERVNAIGL